MASVQSFIRTEVGREAFPAPKGAEAFTAYAIASAKRLIPEMQNAARLTLEHPMTFETLGEGLRHFEGWALHNLVDFRRRSRDMFVSCLDAFYRAIVQRSLWVGCPEVMPLRDPQQPSVPPVWLSELFSRTQNDLKLQKITSPLDVHLRIHQECTTALKKHATCNVCLRIHLEFGSLLFEAIRDVLVEVRDKVTHSLCLSGITGFNQLS